MRPAALPGGRPSGCGLAPKPRPSSLSRALGGTEGRAKEVGGAREPGRKGRAGVLVLVPVPGA